MPPTKGARTAIQRRGADHARSIRVRIGGDLRRAREDAGLSQRHVARLAGVSHSTVNSIERVSGRPTIEAAARLAEALGMTLAVRCYPESGPRVRDHIQSAMLGALIAMLHRTWRATPEVSVSGPVRGVIDLVLEAPRPPIVACEAQSEIRRIEQELRWAKAKSQALADHRGQTVSRLLLVRATRQTRAIASTYAEVLGAAFPAPYEDALASLTEGAPWPGESLIWCRVEGTSATVMRRPPRGVRLGR